MTKRLLKAKGVSFDEIDVFASPSRKAEMVDRAGGRTSVPQIFVGEVHVGGNDDLHSLDKAGKLDDLLANAA